MLRSGRDVSRPGVHGADRLGRAWTKVELVVQAPFEGVVVVTRVGLGYVEWGSDTSNYNSGLPSALAGGAEHAAGRRVERGGLNDGMVRADEYLEAQLVA